MVTPKTKPIKINEINLIRGDEIEFGKIAVKEDSTAKILQRLYRAHRKFNLIIDEEIEVDRDKIREKIKMLSLSKDKQSLFLAEDSKNLEDYEKNIERKIIKLDDQNYKDKWIYIEEWFQIKDGDNQFEYENFEEIK